jgi:hypothetical protein
MGTLGDNLLKLIEFPFSYSFIGLLTLILGQGASFADEEFFDRLGPLLILMGFVATTLTITDPIGGLQKIWLKHLKAESLTELPQDLLRIIERAEKNNRLKAEDIERVRRHVSEEMEKIKDTKRLLFDLYSFNVFGRRLKNTTSGDSPILPSLAPSFLSKIKVKDESKPLTSSEECD